MPIYCPFDTQEIVNPNQISNFALRYRHFLKNEMGDGGKVKFEISATSLGDSQQVIKHLRDRQTEQLRHLATNYHVFCGRSQVDWRLIIGIGGDHVQETGMSLDHIYGIPIIPESAIKGVVRSWVIQEHFGGDENLAMGTIRDDDSEEMKQNKRDFLEVFGSQEQAGKVQFLTAYPNENSVTFATDIMNPHFPNYYAGSQPPTDDQNPVPIHFLTVTGTEYRFVFVTKEQRLVGLVKGWLEGAIKNKGLGAKTAVGYGYFGRLADPPRRLMQHLATPPPVQRPQQTEKPKQHSLEEASELYKGQPSIQLDIEPIKGYAAKLAIIATNGICEIEKIGGIEDIPEILIVKADDLVELSEFGNWVWERVKNDLLASRILVLPRLIYSTAFRRDLIKLSPADRVRAQEELLKLSNQLAESGGDTHQITVGERIRYTAAPEQGTLTLLGYTHQ